MYEVVFRSFTSLINLVEVMFSLGQHNVIVIIYVKYYYNDFHSILFLVDMNFFDKGTLNL